ncbi:MAG: hypothetical protein IKX10_03975, partial [Lachnospiraceae bacterium]|nr:hypothetical protein [Lachnospiraceae bacterium]
MRSFSIALNDALKNDWDYTKGWIKDEAFPYVREFAMDFIGEFLPAGVGGVASLGKYEAERLYAYFTKDYEAYKTGEQDQSTWLRDNVMMNGKAELAPVQTVLRFLVKDLNDVSCQDGLVIQTTPGLYVYKYEWIKTGDSEDEGYWDESCLGAYDLADPKIKTIAKVVLEKGGDFKLLYGKYSCNFGVHLTLDVTAKRIGRVPDTVYSYSWKGDKITIRPGTVGTLIDGQSEFDDLIKVDDPEKMLAILNNTDISWAQALDELREFDYSAYYLGEGIETLDPTDYIKEYKLMPPESGV